MNSKLTKNQVRTYGPKFYTEHGTSYKITAEVRHDDQCGNGHNTFSVTASIDRNERGRWREDSGGCLHEEVAKHFPEVAPLVKWHLCSTDGPLHYIANTMYWLGWSGWTDAKPGSPPNLEHARSTAIWPEMDESYLAPPKPGVGADATAWNAQRAQIEGELQFRIGVLLADFRAAVESVGFTY